MSNKSSTRGKGVTLVVLMLLSMALALSASEASAFYKQTNLVSDASTESVTKFKAKYTDPSLINPWGIASSPTSPFWVSNNGTGVATLYNGAGTPQALVVTIPPPSNPTGQVFNGGSAFNGDRFLFATEGGTIAGWQGGTTAATRVITTGAVYTGLALGKIGSADFLYAANFAGSKIDVFDGNFAPATLFGAFDDPNLPSGYAPFNIQNLGGNLYVTYASPGDGIVDEFDTNGNLVRRLISNGGKLNSPWGLAVAPADFGEFSNALLVGNHGDGKINAFDPLNGLLLGTLSDTNGDPIAIDGLWGLSFGNGGTGGENNILYFTAGPDDETHGLFGSLAPVPLPGTLLLLGSGFLGIMAIPRRWRR